MKKFILATILYIFTVTSTYAGILKFDAGTKIKSYILSVPSYATPMVIDYNYDGKKDLIIGDGNGYVWFYQNFGSDDFPQFSTGSKLTVNNSSIKVTSNATPFVINWDNTKDLDLIVGDNNGNLTLFLSSNDPSSGRLPVLQEGVSITGINHPNSAPSNSAPFVCDWNDDYKKDLIIGDINGNIWVYTNEGDNSNPKFSSGSKVLGTGSIPLDVGNNAIPYVIDWDGMGNKDLIVGNSEGEIYVFLSGTKTTQGTPTFTTGRKVQANNKDIDVGNNSAPFIIDWDNSKNIDLLVGGKDGSLNLYLNSNAKPPVFSISSKIPKIPAEGEVGKDLDAGQRVIPFVIDFNDDGKKDIITGNIYGNVKLYLNSRTDNNPIFSDGYTFQVNSTGTIITELDVGYYASPYIYDWNYDGNKDLIVGDEEGYIYLFINSGNNSIFKPGTKITTGTLTNLPLRVNYDATPIICDWNNDGKMDIVAGERNGYVNLFLNSGNDAKPIFVQSQQIMASGGNINVGKNAKPFVEDFNDDDKKDLIVGNKDGYLKVYLNIGEDKTPVFTTQPPYHFQIQANSPLKVSGYAAPVVVDWNRDKIYDLIVGEEDGYINLYIGTIENSKPEVIPITPVGTQSNNVTINYILYDDEKDVCSIVVLFSDDGGNNWKPATQVVNAGDGISNLNSSNDGIRHSFVWNSSADIGKQSKKVIIKIIPNDGRIEGAGKQTGEFEIDNVNPPRWERIKIKEADLNLGAYSTPIAVDWDEDNKRDLLIGSEDGYVYFCKNIGSDISPKFDVAYRLEVEGGNLLKVTSHSSPFVNDWNSDGKKDLLVGDADGYVTFFENTGSHLRLAQGKKIKIDKGDLIKVPGNAVPSVVDWNNDGYKDLIVGDKNGNVYLYLNKNISPQPDTSPLLSSGIKIQANSELDVGNNATPYMIDIDWRRDYKEDLLIGNSDGYVLHYKNIGSKGTPSFSSGGSKIKFKGEEIKIDANSRPYVLNQDENEIDLIIGSKAGYVFLYQLDKVVINTPPWLSITNPKGTQSTQIGSVTITYTLGDDQWDECSIKVEFSTDLESWYLATGTPKTELNSSPEGVEHTFIWFSKKDLPSADKIPVWLKFTPNDGNTDGSATIVSFILDNLNKLPVITNVRAKSIGKYGQVEILYDLQDGDNDLCQVFVEYQGGSKQNTWATATVVGTTTNILHGTDLKLIWLSAVDEKNQSAKDYKFKITPFDIEYGISGISTSFEINNSSISSAIVPAKTAPTISFSPTTIEVLEPFSNDFDVLITVEKNPKGIPEMNTLPSLNNTVRKITAIKLPQRQELDPQSQRRAKITIPYDNLSSYETESLLRIFELQEGKWRLIGGSPNVEYNYVTVEVPHFSVFRIGLDISTSNDNFKVYPNPFKDNDGINENGELNSPYEGCRYITFQGVNKVKIYTIAGELVRASEENIQNSYWRWDLKNDYGKLVGSGVYIYVVKDINGRDKVGKLGVIR